MSIAIQINGLEKVYKSSSKKEQDVYALKPLNLNINSGEVFGLLGPNGAGKTTLIKMLLGIVYPTNGSAKIEGENIGSTKSKNLIGYLPENHKYPNYLTGEGVLKYFGLLSGVDSKTLTSRTSELLSLVNMSKWGTTRIKKYSKGMMQRLGIAQSLINDPKVVFLDEPTDGVDPVGRKEIREIIFNIRERGKTIFLNSHLLSEVEAISDRVAILKLGELVRLGTVNELTSNQTLFKIEVEENDQKNSEEILQNIKTKKLNSDSTYIDVNNFVELNSLIDLIRSKDIVITSVSQHKQSLEDLFIEVVK